LGVALSEGPGVAMSVARSFARCVGGSECYFKVELMGSVKAGCNAFNAGCNDKCFFLNPEKKLAHNRLVVFEKNRKNRIL